MPSTPASKDDQRYSRYFHEGALIERMWHVFVGEPADCRLGKREKRWVARPMRFWRAGPSYRLPPTTSARCLEDATNDRVRGSTKGL